MKYLKRVSLLLLLSPALINTPRIPNFQDHDPTLWQTDEAQPHKVAADRAPPRTVRVRRVLSSRSSTVPAPQNQPQSPAQAAVPACPPAPHPHPAPLKLQKCRNSIHPKRACQHHPDQKVSFQELESDYKQNTPAPMTSKWPPARRRLKACQEVIESSRRNGHSRNYRPTQAPVSTGLDGSAKRYVGIISPAALKGISVKAAHIS